VETLQSIEAVGASVDEAIGRALDALNVTREQVSVDVIEPGGGKSMARVRVTLTAALSAPPARRLSRPETAGVPAAEDEIRMARGDTVGPAGNACISAPTWRRIRLRRKTLRISTRRAGCPGLNIRRRPGHLIGRAARRCDLQYILRLIVGRQAGRNVNLVVDVEGYKTRREQTLRQLALRMAERAVATRKTVMLEPMPANERRIIHLTLRNHPSVSTQSVGQGDGRKVTIVPNLRGP
jgi:spoIIIJ-associated protein